MFFLELSCFFDDPVDVGNLISVSHAFSKSSLYIWKLSVHVLLKPRLEDFEHKGFISHFLRNIFAMSVEFWVKSLVSPFIPSLPGF